MRSTCPGRRRLRHLHDAPVHRLGDPKELVDAARIDGCSEFAIYWRIVLPLIGPALGTLGLVTFIGSWNNFIGPLIVIRDMRCTRCRSRCAPLQGTGQIPWGAPSPPVRRSRLLPLLVLFMVASRRLIEGPTAGGRVKS